MSHPDFSTVARRDQLELRTVKLDVWGFTSKCKVTFLTPKKEEKWVIYIVNSSPWLRDGDIRSWCVCVCVILLMKEILHQLTWTISPFFIGFHTSQDHHRWCEISSINSISTATKTLTQLGGFKIESRTWEKNTLTIFLFQNWNLRVKTRLCPKHSWNSFNLSNSNYETYYWCFASVIVLRYVYFRCP